MNAVVTMETLSEELIIEIFEFLPKPALVRLSSISKRFQRLALPLLYHTIDLSVHNFKPIPDEKFPSGFQRWPRDIESISSNQYQFTSQLHRNPCYASFVRSFTWSLGIENHANLTEQEKASWNPQNTYIMFSLLNNVTEIDIDGGTLHRELVSSILVPHMASCFPAAQRIRIGGKMHYALASCILHGVEKAPIVSLDLNNIQEGGLLSTGLNVEVQRNTLHFFFFEEDWPIGCFPRQVVSGNMRRILNSSLISRCMNLQSLALRKQGQQAYDQDLPSGLTREMQVYEEWAYFISRVHPAHILFEHKSHIHPLYNEEGFMGSGSELQPKEWILPKKLNQVKPPMDVMFEENILPILIKGWPELRKLEFRGISRKVLGELEHQHTHVEVLVREKLERGWNAVVGQDS